MKLKQFFSLVLALAMCLSLAACGEKDQPSKNDGDSGSADSIVIGRAFDSDNLDPVNMVGNYNIWILNMMLEGLVQTNDKGTEIIPCLAEDWTISDDGLTYTFHLKEGVCFSDGTPVTGEDWVFSFQRAMKSPDARWYFTVENFESVEAPDDSTFVLHLKEVSATTLADLAMWTCGVQSKAHYDKVGEDGYADGFIGTGAYMLKDWKKGESMEFVANPYYHVEGLPKTQNLTFRVIADDSSRTMQLQSGDIDVAINLSMDSLYQLEQDKRVNVHPSISAETQFLALNTKNQYLSNDKVREALCMATDPTAITQVATFGYGTPTATVMPGSSTYIPQDIPVNTPDVEGAKALLADAGYPDGFSLDLMICSGKSVEESIATLVKEQWAQIGVEVNIVSYEKVTYTEKLYGTDFDVVVDYWSDDICDPSEFMTFLCDFDVCSGFDTNYKVPGIEELNKQAKAELDSEKRTALYHEILHKIDDAHIYVPICTIPYASAESTSISGFVQTPLGNLRLSNMTKTVG